MKNNDKKDTNTQDVLQLLNKEDAEKQFGEAIASAVATDQIITWAKFILTDDKPNGNKQRIPLEEFNNIIKTGIYKPVKMALGEIKDGHDDARPLGVITNLTKEGNKIVALAALWDHERTDDVENIKDMVNNGKPVNVSWEILYGNSVTKDGVSDLLDTVLRAVTIVGIPAYAGRTQLLAVAAKKWSPAYINKLPDTSFLLKESDGTRYFAIRDDSGKIDPSRFDAVLEEIANAPLPQNTLKGIRHQVKKLQAMVKADASLLELLGEEDYNTEDYTLDTKELENKVSELEAKLATATDEKLAKEKELADALALAEVANTSVKTLEEELAPLRAFRQEAEQLEQKAAKLSTIKSKFESLNLSKPDEYFSENAEKLLGLDENGLDFMLQEMVAFKSEDGGEGSASLKKVVVPNIQAKHENLSDPKTLAAALRERNKK